MLRSIFLIIILGIGHTQLSELCSSAELPILSSTAYLQHLSNIGIAVQDTAMDEMIKAGNEERRLAIESGNIDEHGVPFCTVIADGQWSKRSYRTKFNAFSGALRNIEILNKNEYLCYINLIIIIYK